MGKRVYNYIGLLLLIVAIFVSLAYSFNWSFTGYAGFTGQSDFSYCDFNITCGFTNWTSYTTYCINESQSTNNDSCFNTVNASNVLIDLQGFYISDANGPTIGNTSYGVYSSGNDNVSLRNGEVRDFSYGAYLHSSPYSTIFNVSFVDNTNGVGTLASQGSNFTNLSSDNSTNIAFRLINSYNSTYHLLDVRNSGVYGIYMENQSTYNNFTNLSSLNDITGLYIDESEDNLFLNSTFTNNYNDITFGTSFDCIFCIPVVMVCIILLHMIVLIMVFN
jgi:hypothetical protein